MNAVDFFCGGGGMTRGLLNAGIQVLFGLDFNPSCHETYEYNNHIPYLCRDIKDVTIEDLINQFPVLAENDDLLLVGCAPCQPFSSQRRSETEHPAVNLLDEFGRIVEGIMPAHILIENVPGIEKKGHEVFERFIILLDRLNYQYTYDVINAKNYGVPQNRRRLVLIASRLFRPSIPEATHGNGRLPYVTVYDRIFDFPAVEAGQENNNVPNHKAAGLSQLNMDRISMTPHDGGGRVDWPPELRLECHTNGHVGHTDIYGRMLWNAVAPTLTSKCYSLSNGRFGHPEQDRAITLREAAALQTFDNDYIFYGSMQEVGRQVGNAVPVLLAENIGRYILKEHNGMQNKNGV